MLGGQKFSSDTEGAISRSSVAWTADRIVLCIGHSEACDRWDKCLNELRRYVEK